jgi:hypothetical protein
MDLKNIKRLKSEKAVFDFLPAMEKSCKLSVLIPVYGESLEMVMRPLLSLIAQKGVGFADFEVVMAVNNSRQEALQKTDVFKLNQKILEALKFMSGEARILNRDFAAREKEWILRVKNSGIRLRAADLSGAKNAKTVNVIGAVRKTVGDEICRRFLAAPVGQSGIIAMTDCDCRVSENYIASILAAFASYNLNGLTGKFELEADVSLPYGDLVMRATRTHLNWPAVRAKPAKTLLFQKQDGIKKSIFMNPNIVVSVKSWLASGGVPLLHSWEDVMFGQKLIGLPGDVAKSADFTVVSLARSSQRGGFMGLGRRVGMIAESVGAYREGKTGRLLVPDADLISNFYFALLYASRRGVLSGNILSWLLETRGFGGVKLSQKELNGVAAKLNKIAKVYSWEQQFLILEQIISQYFGRVFPQKDATASVIGPQNSGCATC